MSQVNLAWCLDELTVNLSQEHAGGWIFFLWFAKKIVLLQSQIVTDTMKSRLLYLLRLYATLLVVFVLQKPLFMLYCGAAAKGVALGDYLGVVWHGLTLDAAVAAYLSILPFVVTVVSLFFRQFPLRKVLTPYLILVAVLVSVIFCVDAAIYPFWGFKLDASIFFYIDSPKDALASVAWWFVAIGVLLILLLCFGLGWLLVKTTPTTLPEAKRGPLVRLGQTGLLLLAGGLIFVAMRGGLGKSTANVGMAYFSNDQFLNHSAVNPHFSLFYSMSKQEDFASEFDFFDEDHLQLLLGDLDIPQTPSDSTLSLLNTDRPNVLIIIMEGFGGGAFVEELGGVPDVSPNLKRLSDEGVFFTNCYAGSFRTDRGTVCVLSGFPGLPTASLMKMPAKSRTLPAISEKLAQAGYKTDFLYGGDINFTNMKSFLLSKGYQKITADVDFSPAERTSNAWGANDEITFDHLYHRIVERKDAPWHTAFLTLSSHEPFEVPYHRLDDPVPNAFAYTDSCLGDFVDRLKQTSAWDSLLIVCIPDHGFFYPRTGLNSDPRIYRIPMLWLGGAVKQPMRVNKTMSQVDMAATLLGQLGLGDSRFKYSRDVLGNNYRHPYAFYTFNNGFGFVDSTGATVFDNNGNKVIYNRDTPGNDAQQQRTDRGKALLQILYDDLGGM